MTTFIKGATILAMGKQHGAEPFTGDILVEGDRITAIGTAVPRKEDARLLSGEGTYTDNLTATGVVHAVIVRSPYPHATIAGVDLSNAIQAL